MPASATPSLDSDPDRWHALDAPFTTWEHWQPVPGTCSRCEQPAEQGATRWWHLDAPCTGRGRPATFTPRQAPRSTS